MTLVKNVNCVIDISTNAGGLGELPVAWFDQDINTAQFTAQIVRNGEPVMLPNGLAKPYLTIVPVDGTGTVFNVPMLILDQTNGIVQYTLRKDYELKHPGENRCQLILAVPSNQTQVISVEFSFVLQQTLLERLGGSGKLTDTTTAVQDKTSLIYEAYDDGNWQALSKRIDVLILGAGTETAPELLAARTDIFGTEYSTLTDRLDAIEQFQKKEGRN